MIVPAHECKQRDVFGPLLFPHSHLLWQKPSMPIFVSFQIKRFELLCFHHMTTALHGIVSEEECGLREDECKRLSECVNII